MDSVFTEVSQTLDWSVEMKRTLKTRARNNNALAMLVKRQFSAYLDAQEELQKAIDVEVTGVSVHGNLQLFALKDLYKG